MLDFPHDWDGNTEGVSRCCNCGVVLSQSLRDQQCPEAEDEDALELEDELELEHELEDADDDGGDDE
jgi:hypothetical protein